MTKTGKTRNDTFRLRLKLDLCGGVMGPGKAELMRKIDALGSISAAAREMGINYRRAWFLLETLSKPLGLPVIVTEKGGTAGGGASLSDSGRTILNAYERCVTATELNTATLLDDLQATLKKQATPAPPIIAD